MIIYCETQVRLLSQSRKKTNERNECFFNTTHLQSDPSLSYIYQSFGSHDYTTIPEVYQDTTHSLRHKRLVRRPFSLLYSAENQTSEQIEID